MVVADADDVAVVEVGKDIAGVAVAVVEILVEKIETVMFDHTVML